MRIYARQSGGYGLIRLILRALVPLTFLLALGLNTLAMSAPNGASASAMLSPTAEHMQANPHVLHEGAKLAHCQQMAQCTGVPVQLGEVTLADATPKSLRTVTRERYASQPAAPPFHPPIL
jgi:hypothetical protein